MPVRPFSYYSLKLESRRLDTFIDWPVTWLKPEELASDGFYYIRHLDHCACAFCGGIVGTWEEGDTPRGEHKRHFSHCPFIIGEPVGNLPLDACKVIAKLKDSAAMRILPLSEMKMPKPSHRLLPPFHTCPERAEFSTHESRLKSFDNDAWPACLQDKIDSMVNAGFFHCGLSDHVRCYYCGKGLCNWDKEDDPTEAHMKWFSECNFVNLNMEWDDSPYTEEEEEDYDEEQVESDEVVAASAVGVTPEENAENGEKVAAIIDDVPITESDIYTLMKTDICTSLVQMGFTPRNVKGALLNTLRETKTSFTSLSKGIESAIFFLEQESKEKLRRHSSEEGGGNDGDASISVSAGEGIPPIMQHSAEASSTPEQTYMFESVLANTSEIPNVAFVLSQGEEQMPVQELTKELERFSCKVCFDNVSNVLFLPCRHQTTCPKCALMLKKCPLCRTDIKYSIKARIG